MHGQVPNPPPYPLDMQDDNSHLLHLGDLSIPEDTSIDLLLVAAIASTGQYPSLLADEDSISLSQPASYEVQQWCLSRITEYQNYNRLLHQSYGAAARNAISRNKCHVRALRSAYNDAAPMHRYLPPEMLMEIFSHIHPAVMTRSRIPVLRVCRYWRRLLFRTPQFWANLLSSPSWTSRNLPVGHHTGRFQAALARSTPESLDLSVPYYNQIIIDSLTPHASRISSFKVGPTMRSVEEMTRFLDQHMPRLTHLTILHCWWYTKIPVFDLRFRRYPNIGTLELERTHFYAPVVPYPSLRHLKLKYCNVCPSPASSTAPTLCAVHSALELFPNLETLSMTRSLSDANDLDGRAHALSPELPELKKTVHLPRLRHLELEDIPDYIPRFLSHLIIPATASLVLEPAHVINHTQRLTVVPLFLGINPVPSPNAELSLCLYFRATRHRKELALWETHGDGVRLVRITAPIAVFHVAIVCCFTRELAAALAPAPALGVTSLTVEGRPLSTEYWAQVLRELPGLRRFTCQRVWTTHDLAGVVELGRRSPGRSGELPFPCARLEELVLGWELWSGFHNSESALGAGDSQSQSLQRDDSEFKSESPELAAALSEFCDTLGACLTERALAGHCEPIRKLSVSLRWHVRRNSSVCDGWKGQADLLEKRLRCTLGHLVGDIAVGSEVT